MSNNNAKNGNSTNTDNKYLDMDLLRFTTAGSVDDGKSTLIGKLLYDSKSIFEDQMEAIEQSSLSSGEDDVNLALLTDGLKAEREQKITIDVAYRYFATPKRKFIIADTPGHIQYTRNMVTGASTAELAVILVDASKGVLTQSKRHAFISSLLQIPHMVVAINKMDLVDYDQDVYDKIVNEFRQFSRKLDVDDITYIPISALKGDNVVEKGENMPWYKGTTLLHFLENVKVNASHNIIDFRLPVQYVIRPNQNFRGFSGRIASGRIRPGEEIVALPSGISSRVKEVVTADGNLEEAYPGDSVTLTLEDEIDISRGDMIVRKNNRPNIGNEFEAYLCWMNEEELKQHKPYIIRHTSRTTQVFVDQLIYRINVDTLHREDTDVLQLNEIGRARLKTSQPLFFDPYKINQGTGSFVIIDPASNVTVGAGMIRSGSTQSSTEDQKPKTANRAADYGEPGTGNIGDRGTDNIGERGIGNAERESKLRPPSRGDGSGKAGSRGVSVDKGKKPISPNVTWEPWNIPREEREKRNGHKAAVLWFSGVSGAGKSTIARALEKKLWDLGKQTILLDGDQVRHGLNGDLGFSPEDRTENIRRVGEVARLFFEQGNIVLCSFVSPYQKDRKAVCDLFPGNRYVEIHVHCEPETAQNRDPKGLYEKARKGEIKGLTGYDAPYEESDYATLKLDTDASDLEEILDSLLEKVLDITAEE